MSIPIRVLELALGVEQSLDPDADNMHLYGAFLAAAEGLPAEDESRQFLLAESAVHFYRIERRGVEKNARSLGFPGGSAPVESIPEDVVEYLRQRLSQSTHQTTRTRLADLLWQRTNEFAFAQVAIREYVQAAPRALSGRHGTSAACSYIGRASELALSLRQDTSAISAAIRPLAEQFLAEGNGYLAKLVEVAGGVIAKDADLAGWFLKEASDLALRVGSGEKPNRLLERRLFAVCADLASLRGEADRARAFREQFAHSLEDEAMERASDGGLIQSTIFQDAIKAYADLGMGDAVDRLKPLLHEATQRAGADTQRISTSFEIPHQLLEKEVDACLAAGREKSAFAHLLRFAERDSLWPAWSEITTQVEERARMAPLQALVRLVTITDDGRPFERPGDPAAAREFDEVRLYGQEVFVVLGILLSMVEIFRNRQAWTVDLIMEALSHGAFFDGDILKAIRPGVQAFEDARHWDSAHVLLPQIERVIRRIAERLGARTQSYKSQTGELHWASLKTLLEEPKVVDMLAKVRPDLARHLKSLLIDSRGLNLRDDACHGILPPDVDAERIALLCILILLTVSMLVRPPTQTADGSTAEPSS